MGVRNVGSMTDSYYKFQSARRLDHRYGRHIRTERSYEIQRRIKGKANQMPIRPIV